MTSNPAWSQPPDQFSALTPMDTQDFTLDVNFDFDFLNDFGPTNNGDTNGKLVDSNEPPLFATSAHQQHGVQSIHLSSTPLTMAQGLPMFDMGMHFNAHNGQPYTMQTGHNPMGHHQMIPSTPNSVEMHANAAHYMQQQMDAQSRAMMEQYQMAKPDIVSMARNCYHFNTDMNR